MKAKLISEEVHNFERNKDPFKSLGLGVKNQFYDLMPKSIFSEMSEFWKDWVKMKAILDKPTTNIQFTNPLKEAKIRKEMPYVTISLPPDPLNWFFFRSMLLIIYSHSPRKLTSRSIQDNNLTLYINQDA